MHRSDSMGFSATHDVHRGVGDLYTEREEATSNRLVEDVSTNWLFHFLNLVLLNRALPLSQFFRRAVGATHCTTLNQTKFMFRRIDQSCALNAVVVGYPLFVHGWFIHEIFVD